MRNPPAVSGNWGWCPRGTASAMSVNGQESSPPENTSPESSNGSRLGSSKNWPLNGTPCSTSQW